MGGRWSLMLGAVMLVAAACGGEVTAAMDPVAECGGNTVVVGLDTTGSYELTGALEAVAELVEAGACPGDRWYFRAVTEDSYSAKAALFRADFAEMPPEPQATALVNPFEPVPTKQARALAAAATAEGRSKGAAVLREQRRDVAARVRALTWSEPPATDVVGFFAKAGELLANTPERGPRVVVLASDLEDNAGRDLAMDLTGAVVLVVAFETDSGQETQDLRREWCGRLNSAGAAGVVFLDPTEPVTERYLASVSSQGLPGEEGIGGLCQGSSG